MKTCTLLLIILCIAAKGFAQAGTPDSTFSHDGILYTPFYDGTVYASSVAIQANKKIIVGGDFSGTALNSPSEFVLVRYMPDGTIDHHFGNDGRVLTQIKTIDHCNNIAIQPDGKILAVGTSYLTFNEPYNETYMTLVRYKINGEPDSSFGKNGIISKRFKTDTYGYAVALQQNNKIVVTGRCNRPETNYYYSNSIFLARFNNDGKSDSSFGDNGVVITPGKSSLEVNAMAIQSSDKIVVGGYTMVTQGYQYLRQNFMAARYTKDGRLDSSFGNNGFAITKFGKADFANSLVLQPDNKIVLIGTAYKNNVADIALVRLTKNGLPDSSFSTNHDGKLLIHTGNNAYGVSVNVQADGKIIAAGDTKDGYYQDFYLSRYNKNGIVDNTFGNQGSISTKIRYSNEGLSQTALQPDGKIVAIGSSSGEFTVVRYKGDSTASLIADNNLLQPQNATTNKPISIYLSPNPVKNILNIQGLSASLNTIAVIDNTGKTLQAVITSNKTYLMNVQQLAAGIYFIKIDDGKQIVTQKFIKK